MVESRLRQAIELNLGVRYDLFTPITEAHNRYANIDYDTLTLITGTQDPDLGLHSANKNVAPCIGFSYSIGQQVVLRGGYGISYYPTQSNLDIELANPPHSFQSIRIAFPALPLACPLPSPPAPPTSLAHSATLLLSSTHPACR